MNRICAVIITVVVAASSHALAAQPASDGLSVIGRVDSIYIREHHGLYIETRLVPRDARGKELWALVRYAASANGGPGSELTRIPAGIELRDGDVVEISTGEKGGITAGPLSVARSVVRRLQGEQNRLATESVSTTEPQ